MRDAHEIAALVWQLMEARQPTIEMMRLVANRYDIDYVLPIPEVPNEPKLPPFIPALMADAVDGLATRAASQNPMLFVPALDGSKDRGVRSREYASVRRKTINSVYTSSRWALGRRRWYRQLSAYSTASVIVYPNRRTELPVIQVRSPLHTFPEQVAAEEYRPPDYVAFVQSHSAKRLRKIFPASRQEMGGPIPINDVREQMWDVCEWLDGEQCAFVLLGPSESWAHAVERNGGSQVMFTKTMMLAGPYPNYLDGRIPAICPDAIQLEKVASRMASLVGTIDWQGKLMALDVLAQEKAIYPDTYIIGRANGSPMIVGGHWKDGRTGEVNVLQDIEAVGQLRGTPDLRTSQLIDRLERNFSKSAGVIPQMAGENYGSLRTGRAIDAISGIALDPHIQELHEISQSWMPYLNELILDTFRAHWPNKTYTLYSGWYGDHTYFEMRPATHIEACENTVQYPIPGADAVQATQVLGSLLGTRAISLRTFRQMHPWIMAPEEEGAVADEELFEQGLAQAIVAQLQSGQIPLPFASKIKKYLRKGLDIFEAVEKAEEELRKQQAQELPEAPEGMTAPPQAMPGLAAGPDALQPQVPRFVEGPVQQVGVPGDVDRMRQLMQTMAAG